MGVMGTLNAELASFLLGILSSNKSVAYFKVAMQSVALISLALNSINLILAPNVAMLYKKNNFKEMQYLLRNSVRLSSIVALPFLLVLIFFSNFLVLTLFGDEYLPSVLIIQILAIGQVFNVCMGSVNLILNMTGNEKKALRVISLTLIVTALLMLTLIPLYQEVGAAVAAAVSMVMWNLLMAIDIYKTTKIKTWLH